MDRDPSAAPVRYEPSMERVEADEGETRQSLDETLKGIQETTFKHAGTALRSVHAKAHGLLHGTFTVPDGLAPELAQGLFERPGSYPAVMRFSTTPGDMLPDSVSSPRGVAVKVVGVEGERLGGSEGATTQDFVLVNGPVFAAKDPRAFLGSLKRLAATTDHAAGAKEALSHVLRAAEGVMEAFGAQSGTLVRMGGQQPVHILGETFYSQTPFLYGAYMAKFSLVPVSPALLALADETIDIDEAPDALREAVRMHFARIGGEWEFRVQLRTDAETMPIEDPTVEWPQTLSPYRPVARLSVPPQGTWTAENRRSVDEAMSFGPWHGLAAHRPLGGVNRARQQTYAHSARFRAEHNGCPLHEPRRDELKGAARR